MKVSVLSDIHIDSWVDPYMPKPQQEHLINELIIRVMPENSKDHDVITQFLKLNFCGVPQSKEHIDFIKSLKV